jgi:hypothetical protein
MESFMRETSSTTIETGLEFTTTKMAIFMMVNGLMIVESGEVESSRLMEAR